MNTMLTVPSHRPTDRSEQASTAEIERRLTALGLDLHNPSERPGIFGMAAMHAAMPHAILGTMRHSMHGRADARRPDYGNGFDATSLDTGGVADATGDPTSTAP